MKNLIKFSTLATLVLGGSHAALAENRVPAELAADITPNYRHVGIKNASGEQYVLVKRIEGHDRNGKTQVLFKDAKGVLLPVAELTKAHKLINPSRVEKKGNYRELQVQLGDNSFTLGKTGMKQQPLPMNIASKMVLHGQVKVQKFEVSSNGLSLLPPDSHKVAKLIN